MDTDNSSIQDLGLSPLARGTLRRADLVRVERRFIPAGAGNTREQKFLKLAKAVYPRWRGEHLKAIVLSNDDNGLSPLARGTLPTTSTNW